jgi:hypothetical protein
MEQRFFTRCLAGWLALGRPDAEDLAAIGNPNDEALNNGARILEINNRA